MARRRQFGSVRQKTNGKWQARYQDAEGAEHYAVFNTKGEAGTHLAKAEADLERGDWFDPRAGTTTVEEWADDWFKTKRNLRYRTRTNYGYSIRLQIKPFIGHVPLARLTPERVEVWLVDMEAEGVQPSVAHRAYKVLNLMMKLAVQRRYVRANPCEPVEAPTLAVRKQLFLTPYEVGAVAEEISKRVPQYRTLVLLAAYGGLRWGELAGLDVGHVDFLRRRVRVERQLHPNGTLDKPKTDAGTRCVDIPAWLADELAVTVAERKPSATLAPEHRELLFLTEHGQRLHSSNFGRRLWRPAVIAALPERLHTLRFHDLRHTAVALYLQGGEDAGRPINAKRLQMRMGHSSIQMTFDRYGHLLPQDEDAAVNAMPSPFSAPAADAEVVEIRAAGPT